MAAPQAPRRVSTPPKGRPTRPRRGRPQRRVFGSTAQWIGAIAVLLLMLIIVIVVFDDDAGTNGTTEGAVVGWVTPATTSVSSPAAA
jgi:hypothetical protein